MFKFAAKVLDIFDESPGELLTKLSGDMPEFVRDAVVPDAKELGLISDYDFAIVFYNLKTDKMRKYLLVDPGNIWMSAKYFNESRDNWPKIAQGIIIRSILSRAEKHGIDSYPVFEPLKEIKTSLMSEGTWKKLPEQNIYDEKLFKRDQDKEEVLRDQSRRSGSAAKQPSEKLSRVYALQAGDDSWVDRPMYDITTPELLKKASDYFSEYKQTMPLRTKRKFARAVLNRANELNTKVGSDIQLYGSTDVDSKLAYETMVRRAKLCKTEHRKLAADILGNSQKMSCDELIDCIEAFDKLAFGGMPNRFGLPDPVESVSKGNKEDEVLYDTGVRRLTVRDLKKVVTEKSAKLEEVFSDGVVKSLKSTPEKAFKALPQPYKKVIANLAS